MILRRLTLSNFKSFRQADLAFPESGLIGIIGANGAGKSTIFEAVLFALYGQVPLDKELLRHAGATAKEPVTVELRFAVRGEEYLVKREFRGKAMTVGAELRDAAGRQLADQSRAVNEEVARLVGLDHTAFSRSVFARQKELDILSAEQPEERKRLVRRMLGLDRIDRACDLANAAGRRQQEAIKIMERELLSDDARATLAAEIAARQADELVAREQKDKARQAAEQARREHEAATTREAELRGIKDRRTEIEHEIGGTHKTVEAKHEQFERETADLAEMARHEEEARRLKPRVEELKALLKERTALLAARERANQRRLREQAAQTAEQALREAQAEVTRRQAERDALGDKLSEADRAAALVQQSELALRNARAAETAAWKEVAAVQELIDERENRRRLIELNGPNEPCPTCRRPMQDDYPRVLSALSAELRSMREERLAAAEQAVAAAHQHRAAAETADRTARDNFARAQAEAQQTTLLETELGRAVERVEKAQDAAAQAAAELAAFGEAPFDPEALAANEARERELRPDADRHTQLLGMLKVKPVIENDIRQLWRELEHFGELIAKLNAQLAALPFDAAEYERAREQVNVAARAMADAEKIAGKLANQHQDLVNQLRERQRQLDEDDRRRRAIADERAQADDLAACAEALRSFRTAVLGHVTPAIDGHASALFARVTRGRYPRIRVTDEFDFVIADDGGEYPIRRFSGGEIDLANLCLRVAIGRVVAELGGQSAPGLLAFDEVFGSQDDERRQLLLDALGKLEGQVLVISHLETVKDALPHVLLVTRDADGSRAMWL